MGCGSATDKFKKARPKTVDASGVLTYRNQPVADAIIVCFPAIAGEKAVAASAYTGSDGRFTLRAFPPDKGAVPGDYRVTIQKDEEGEKPPSGPDAHDTPPPAAGKSLIPAKYNKVENSGLTLTIPEAGKTDIKIELTD